MAAKEEAPKHASVVEALYALQQEVGALPRDSNNPFFSSRFSSFPAIRDRVDPIAFKHGLFVRQDVRNVNGAVCLRNRLYFNGVLEDDDDVEMLLQVSNPQGFGSAVSYYRRYLYTTCLGLVSATDDDDGNAASPRPAPAAPRVVATRPTPVEPSASESEINEEF